jgi:threonine dehydrogenase-like Zn-dependent dehydrogenase
MKTLWLEQQKLTFRPDTPRPEPPVEEALIRVRLAGICSTDLEMVRGYYPFAGIPGHEFAGEVVDVNSRQSESRSWIGKRVVGEINAACGQCETCQRGDVTHCEHRTVLGILNRNGVFTEYTTLPIDNLHLIPDSVPDQSAVFTEPLAAALEIQQQVQIHPTDRVLVIGAGRLGQLIAQTLALTGCRLQVVARHPGQKELLHAWGIETIPPEDIPERKLDIVVEATGSQDGFSLARRAIRPRGTIVLKSTYKGEASINFSALVVDEITLVGSRCGPFPPALRLLDSGLVDPLPLIADTYCLEDGLPAFERAKQPGVLKVLLEP